MACKIGELARLGDGRAHMQLSDVHGVQAGARMSSIPIDRGNMPFRWNRQWTAEENRHGDLMNKYCYLTGRVNMKVS